jgi:hypothetical protein
MKVDDEVLTYRIDTSNRDQPESSSILAFRIAEELPSRDRANSYTGIEQATVESGKITLCFLLTSDVPLERLLEKLDQHSLVSLVKGLVKGDSTQMNNIVHFVESIEKEKEQSLESMSAKFSRLKVDQKNWNKDFQTLLAQENSLEKFNQLFHLAHDFVYAARTYAKVPFYLGSLRSVRSSFQNWHSQFRKEQ